MMEIKLLFFIILTAAADAQSLAGCPNKCGDVDIPYPFGVGVQPGTSRNCFLNKSFSLTCDNSTSTLYFRNVSVFNISFRKNQMEISTFVSTACLNQSGPESMHPRRILTDSFTISNTQNKFITFGCDAWGVIAFQNHLRDNVTYYSGCAALCDRPPKKMSEQTCTGTGCCKVDIPEGMNNISYVVYNSYNHTKVSAFNNCSYAFAAKHDWFSFSLDYLQYFPYDQVPLVLDWTVSNVTCQNASEKADYACTSNSDCVDSTFGSGYNCICKPGFEGNPYHPDGCHDVDECGKTNNCSMPEQCRNFDGTYQCSCPHGYKGDGYINGTGCTLDTHECNDHHLLVLITALGILVAFSVVLTLVFALCWARKQRILKQLRQKNFVQNGGNLLLEQLSQQQGYSNQTKIFTEVELKNATNNFDECRILGRGGQGIVYKGLLPDNTLVAIKKSKVGGNLRQIKDFINEVFVLSQVNHRNIVKLLGCCLETDVPMLVYEFVNNGTLLDHIDPLKNEFSIPWETRLRIATETAEAISYLHSSASIPIIHRDIKSTNILLDHNLRAKVSDFGASKLIPLDETHVTTVVQGTLGYLDPEYLHIGQLKEKSDVYSFGVVLVELLTGKKAVEFSRPEQKNLAMCFVSSMKEDHLLEILDKRVLDRKNANQLKGIALLARRCVRVKGEERPTMKEVAKELEDMIAMKKHVWEMKGDEEIMSEESEYFLGHVANMYSERGASTSASYDSIMKEIASEIADGR